jgi:hypothetical protein
MTYGSVECPLMTNLNRLLCWGSLFWLKRSLKSESRTITGSLKAATVELLKRSHPICLFCSLTICKLLVCLHRSMVWCEKNQIVMVQLRTGLGPHRYGD